MGKGTTRLRCKPQIVCLSWGALRVIDLHAYLGDMDRLGSRSDHAMEGCTFWKLERRCGLKYQSMLFWSSRSGKGRGGFPARWN